VNKKRVIVIVIDGVGIGEMPDADKYGDRGSNTLANLARAVGGLDLPNLEQLGLGNIESIDGLKNNVIAKACYGKMTEVSPGKDSTTGHWELAGLILDKPFPTYPNGFPPEIIREFTKRTQLDILGNYAASGTEILKDLGEEHIRTGKPIVYTSADSVFQIAAHEDIIPLKRLYEICKIARDILSGNHAVARVIARPFMGKSKNTFQRTKYRRDFSLKPFNKTLHQILQDNDIFTVGIGKINDLYAVAGIQKSLHTKSNEEGMSAIISELEETQSGLIMANLVDFDMLWGHRNDPKGFYNGLKKFDEWLANLFKVLNDNDLVMITADHGNDPTTPSTDHSREYVPILVFGGNFKNNVDLGVRSSFADLQATLTEYFEVPSTGNGKSFLEMIL
jgi:phosphopentomutase